MEELLVTLTRGNVPEVKIVLATVVALLAAYQVALMAVGYGKLRLPLLKPLPERSSREGGRSERERDGTAAARIAGRGRTDRRPRHLGGDGEAGPDQHLRARAAEEQAEEAEEAKEEAAEEAGEGREDSGRNRCCGGRNRS